MELRTEAGSEDSRHDEERLSVADIELPKIARIGRRPNAEAFLLARAHVDHNLQVRSDISFQTRQWKGPKRPKVCGQSLPKKPGESASAEPIIIRSVADSISAGANASL